MEMNNTAEEVRNAFKEGGVTITEWAAKNGFSRRAVYAALSGQTHGLRGQAHRVALALGLKTQAPPLGQGLRVPLRSAHELDQALAHNQ